MGPRGSMEDFGEEKNKFPLLGFEARMLPVRSLVDILSALLIVRVCGEKT